MTGVARDPYATSRSHQSPAKHAASGAVAPVTHERKPMTTVVPVGAVPAQTT